MVRGALRPAVDRCASPAPGCDPREVGFKAPARGPAARHRLRPLRGARQGSARGKPVERPALVQSLL